MNAIFLCMFCYKFGRYWANMKLLEEELVIKSLQFLNQNLKLFAWVSFHNNLLHPKSFSLNMIFLRLKCKQSYWFSCWKCFHSFSVHKGSPEKIKFFPFFWIFFFNLGKYFCVSEKLFFLFLKNLLKCTPAVKMNWFLFRFIINVQLIFILPNSWFIT